jgi:hypothetical protein
MPDDALADTRPTYGALLALPPAAARRVCVWASELSACARAMLLGVALDAAAARHRVLSAHLARVARARALAARSPSPAAEVPVHYADRALEAAASAAANVRCTVDALVGAVDALAPDVARIADDAQRLSHQLAEHAPLLARAEQFKALCFRELQRRLAVVASGDQETLALLPNASWPKEPS